MKLDDGRLTKIAFNTHYEQCGNNWSYMRELFRNLNLENEFSNKETINIDSITDTIQENAKAAWLDSVNRKSKLRT